MKLSYLIALSFLFIKTFSAPPRYQYVVSYCTQEDTVFDSNHKPILTDGKISFECTNKIYEFRNGDCPSENNEGLNTISSPTKCYRVKSYNGSQNMGDGETRYKDAANIDWDYLKIGSYDENENPKIYISLARKTGEFCVEIPLLKYKIVIFNNNDEPSKPGYFYRMQMEGTRYIWELRRENKPREPLNPVEARIIYEFKYLFEENRNSLIVTNPNPFDRDLKIIIPKAVLDSNTNLKLILKDLNGKNILEQNVEGSNTTMSTLFVEKGKYVLFLYKKEEMLEYKQVVK